MDGKVVVTKNKIVLSAVCIAGFIFLTGFVREVSDIFAGLNLIADTVSDINDATVEEELIQKQLRAINEQQLEMETSLQELDYTEAEIRDILGTDARSGTTNTLMVLRRAAQNVKRVKDLIKRLKGVGKFNPDVATAGYTALSARSLSDIKILLAQVIYNQNRDYQDRILERAQSKRDWDKTRKMIHAESSKVASGKITGESSHNQSFQMKPQLKASSEDNENGASSRLKKWWNGRGTN